MYPDTPKASVGKRTQTLRISAFAVMAKYDGPLTKMVNLATLADTRDDAGGTVIGSIDVECLETLVFGASPP